MNRKPTPRYYDVLKVLQRCKRAMTAAQIAEELEISEVTVWVYFQALHKEELLKRVLSSGKDKGRPGYVIRMTEAGRAWSDPQERKEDPNVPRYKCGHPIVPSTHFCLECHNHRREIAFQNGDKKYAIPVMARQYA